VLIFLRSASQEYIKGERSLSNRPAAGFKLCLLTFLSIFCVAAFGQTPNTNFVGAWEGEMLLGKPVKLSLVFERATAGHIGFVQDPDGSRVPLAAVKVSSDTITFRLERGEGSFMTFVGKQSADSSTISGSVVVTADGTERGKTTWKAQRISSTTVTAPVKPSAPSSDAGARPPAAQAAYILGGSLFKTRDFDGAASAFTECLSMRPRDTGCLYYRGLSYQRSGKHKEAVDDMTSAIEFSPKAPAQVYIDRALSRLEIEKYDEAVADSETALGMQGPPEAYLSRGRSLYKKAVSVRFNAIMYDKAEWSREARELAAKALIDYEKYISIKPQDYRGYYHRGELYFSRWNVFDDEKDTSFITRSVTELTKAIGFDPQDPAPYYARSAAYRVLGKNDLAAADERKAASFTPKK
jgi:tetratricopeptide (TPR) repeat protein